MKFRAGFVTNSSSSSFLIVGVENQDIIEKMVAVEPTEVECSYGTYTGKHFAYCGSWHDVYWAGIWAEDLLNKDYTLSEIKKIFLDKCKSLGIDVSMNDIQLLYGESGE